MTLHHTVWKLLQCNQNVTNSCHTFPQINNELLLRTGIKINQWESV